MHSLYTQANVICSPAVSNFQTRPQGGSKEDTSLATAPQILTGRQQRPHAARHEVLRGRHEVVVAQPWVDLPQHKHRHICACAPGQHSLRIDWAGCGGACNARAWRQPGRGKMCRVAKFRQKCETTLIADCQTYTETHSTTAICGLAVVSQGARPRTSRRKGDVLISINCTRARTYEPVENAHRIHSGLRDVDFCVRRRVPIVPPSMLQGGFGCSAGAATSGAAAARRKPPGCSCSQAPHLLAACRCRENSSLLKAAGSSGCACLEQHPVHCNCSSATASAQPCRQTVQCFSNFLPCRADHPGKARRSPAALSGLGSGRNTARSSNRKPLTVRWAAAAALPLTALLLHCLAVATAAVAARPVLTALVVAAALPPSCCLAACADASATGLRKAATRMPVQLPATLVCS